MVKSKTHQTFLLLDTDDDELYKVLDAGLGTIADVLSGEYANSVAATAKLAVLYDWRVGSGRAKRSRSDQ